MNCPLHLVGLLALAPTRNPTRGRIPNRRTCDFAAKNFPPLELPTLHQIHRDVPFTAYFLRRIRPRM